MNPRWLQLMQPDFKMIGCNLHRNIPLHSLEDDPSPVLMPSVNIQAPVVSAARMSPLQKACDTLGGRGKFSAPPWTEITSLGSSICHSLSIRCVSCSALVLHDSLTYCRCDHNSHEATALPVHKGSMRFTYHLLLFFNQSIRMD